MAVLVVVLALLCCTGCGGLRIGQASTVFAIGTAAQGIGDINNKACIWILGTSGMYRGMAVLVAQGNATLEECRRQEPSILAPLTGPGPAPSP